MRVLALGLLTFVLFATSAEALIDPVRSLAPVDFAEHEVGTAPVSVLSLPSGQVVRAAGTAPFDGRFALVGFGGSETGVGLGFTPVGMFTFGDAIVNLVGFDRSGSLLERRTISSSLSLVHLDTPSVPAGACAAEDQQFFAWGGLPSSPWVARFTLAGARVWLVSRSALESVAHVESVACGTSVAVAGKNDAGEDRVALVTRAGQVAWARQPFPLPAAAIVAGASAMDRWGRALVAYESLAGGAVANAVFLVRFDPDGVARIVASTTWPAFTFHPTALLVDRVSGFVLVGRTVSMCAPLPKNPLCGGQSASSAAFERFDASGNPRALGGLGYSGGSVVFTSVAVAPSGFLVSGSVSDSSGRWGITTRVAEYPQVPPLI